LKEEVSGLLLKNFKLKEFKGFFDPGDKDIVYQEKEILDKNGHLKRVDRFMIREKSIEVIDFKTGEEDKKEHEVQIRTYMDLLGEIYPDKVLEGYLCYLDEASVKKIAGAGA